MKKTVKAGPILDYVKGRFKKWLNSLGDIFEVKKSEEIEEDGIVGQYFEFETGNGNTLQVKLFPSPAKETDYIIRLAHDGGKNVYESDKLVSEDKLMQELTDYCNKYDLGTVDEEDQTEGRNMSKKEANKGMGEADLEDDIDAEDGSDVEDESQQATTSSNKIAVTLQRVSAGDEDTINLCAINASNAVKAMNMLDEILSDDEFVATITAEPASFEITETTDEYDVQNTDTVDTSHTFEEMLKACVECYHNLECIHWAAKGKQFKEIHSLTESLLWDVKYNVDTIAEWCVEFTKKVPNVLSYQYTPLEGCDGFDFESAVAAAKGQIDNYIKVLECYYVNVEHDVQSVMDNWIRNLKKTSNYALDRTLMPECTTECPHTL